MNPKSVLFSACLCMAAFTIQAQTIFNVSLSFVAHRDDALDITQEVLIKIATKLSTFRQESDFKTWVYRIGNQVLIH